MGLPGHFYCHAGVVDSLAGEVWPPRYERCRLSKSTSIVEVRAGDVDSGDTARLYCAAACLSPVCGRDAIVGPWLTEKVLNHLLCNQAELFEFVVRALDLAFVDGEFLRESGGRGKLFAGRQSLVLDLRLDLLANLGVDGIVGKIFQFDVHNIS